MTTVYSNGTQSTSTGTEHELDDVTDDGVFELNLDLSDLVDGDLLRITCYIDIYSGATERVLWQEEFQDAQPANALAVKCVPVNSPIACRFTVKQVAGTASIPWAIHQLDA